jgi:hypothetical protein
VAASEAATATRVTRETERMPRSRVRATRRGSAGSGEREPISTMRRSLRDGR